jgi:UDP-N-acetylglucosamine 2-epimerase (non-hydrolysing)
MKILSVVGARPQFVKLAPIHHALIAAGHRHIIVHTGQHYDRDMSEVFFEDLGIPQPDENLSVGSASHGRQTAAMLGPLEESFLRHKPDWVLVYGDTNSTLAASLAAVKISQRLAHLEAGLRSFNRRMPEEHNRVLTDHAADLLLAPTDVAAQHLANEGLSDRTVVVGDVMTDICLATQDRIKDRPPQMPDNWLKKEQYIISTIHRQENTDDPNRLRQILGYLAASTVQVRLLAHPRLKAKAQEFGIQLAEGAIAVFDPLSYPQLVHAVVNAQGVVTDSGGLQKEAFLLQTPCVTLRTETEWVETVALGWNVLDPQCAFVIHDIFNKTYAESAEHPFGMGTAARNVVQALEEAFING